jgi:mono/diheme cytochrome c family protein
MEISSSTLTARRAGANALAFLIAFGVFCALPSRGQASDDALDQARAESGRVWYDKYCTSCHGAGGAPGEAVYRESKKPVDLRHYVARHGGKFPAGDWLLIVTADIPSAVHTPVWKKIRDDQPGTSSPDAVARGVVADIAAYVRSVQAK